MCNLQCALYSVQYTMYNVQCAMYSVQCAMYNVQCATYNVQCTMCNVQCAMYSVQCAMYNVQYAMCTVQCFVTIFMSLFSQTLIVLSRNNPIKKLMSFHGLCNSPVCLALLSY
jgi:hypothetical protein